MIPLAHDLLGNPVTVPEQAISWRVRRQTGRQGRPGFVYAPNGAPLVVPLDATADDLRVAGCGSGTYRLDALDDKGRPVGVTAFTEIPPENDEVPAPAAQGNVDTLRVAVEAFARTVEAMQRGEGLVRVLESVQRAQAERDKVTGQVILALVDRSGGARGGTPDLRIAVKQALAVQDAMDEASERRAAKYAPPDPPEPAAPVEVHAPTNWMDLAAIFLQQFAPAVAPAVQGWLLGKLGLSDDQIAILTKLGGAAAPGGAPAPAENAAAASAPPPAAPSTPTPPAAGSGGTAPASSGAGAPAPPNAAKPAPADLAAKLNAIWARLSSEEAKQIQAILAHMTPDAIEKAMNLLTQFSLEEALDFLRAQLKRGAEPPAVTPAGATGTPGAASSGNGSPGVPS